MEYFLLIIGVFVSGMVCAVNLSGLIAVNTSYEFAWWKVVVAVLFAMLCGVLAFYEASISSRR